MFYDFYRLKQNPFAEIPDLDFLFLSRRHKAALHAMIRGLEEPKRCMVLVGEAGLGKTMLLQVIQERIQQQQSQLVWLSNPKLSFHEVLTLLCQECGVSTTTNDPAERLAELKTTLLQGRQHGWRVILLLDDAHAMPAATLTQVFQLSELAAPDGTALLPLILAGRPLLQRSIPLPAWPFQRQQAVLLASLKPLSMAESLAYIRHRLTKVLMPDDALFTAEALKTVLRAARGNPRALNTLCSCLLMTGAMRQQKPVSAELAMEALADITGRTSRPDLQRYGIIAAGLAFGAVLWYGGQIAWKYGTLPYLSPQDASPPQLYAPTRGETALSLAARQRGVETNRPFSNAAPSGPTSQLASTTEALLTLPSAVVVPTPTQGKYVPFDGIAVETLRSPTPTHSQDTRQFTPPSTFAAFNTHLTRFHSSPGMAVVSINGHTIGSTPVVMFLNLGLHTIRIEKSGYISIQYTLSLERAGESNLYHDLSRPMNGR